MSAPASGQTRPAEGPRFRLLEAGLSWPPETFILRKLAALAAEGVDVTVAASLEPGQPVQPIAGIRLERLPHWNEAPARKCLGVLKELSRLPFRHPRRLYRLRRDLLSAVRAQGLVGAVTRVRLWLSLAQLDADVIHIEWLGFAASCRPLLEVWRRPVVLSCHGMELQVDPFVTQRRPVIADYPAVFERATLVHCIANALAWAGIPHGLTPKKTRVIGSAVDPSFFVPADREPALDDSFRIVSVGTLRWIKGYEYALLTLAELWRAGVPVRFDIVGGDPGPAAAELSERERILGTAADLGIADRVFLHGAGGLAEVRQRLWAADAFLLMSLSEGMPNAVIEAMACGLPVVATDVGGLREVVTDGVDGLLVPGRDVRAATDALFSLWREPDLRRRLGTAARAKVEAHYAVDSETRAYLALYEEAMSRRPEDILRPIERRGEHQFAPQRAGQGNLLRLLVRGSLTWEGHIEHLLTGLASLRDHGVVLRCLIVNDGPYAAAAAFACHQLGLRESVALVPKPSRWGRVALGGWADAIVDAGGDQGPLSGLPGKVPMATMRRPAPPEAVVLPAFDPHGIAASLRTFARARAVEPAPRVTAVIPVRHYHARFFAEALASLLGQTDPCWKALVVREPGVELPPAAAFADPRVRVMESEGQRLAGKINTALRHAETDYLAVLLGDDLWGSEAIEVLNRWIEWRPDVDFFHSSRAFIDAAGQRISSVYTSRPSFSRADFVHGSPVKHLHCYRRLAALEIGGIDETLLPIGADDWDFPWRMFEAGATFQAIADCLYLVRDHREAFRLTTHVPLSAQLRALREIHRRHGVGWIASKLTLFAKRRGHLRQSLYRNALDRWWKERRGHDPRRGWREPYR